MIELLMLITIAVLVTSIVLQLLMAIRSRTPQDLVLSIDCLTYTCIALLCTYSAIKGNMFYSFCAIPLALAALMLDLYASRVLSGEHG